MVTRRKEIHPSTPFLYLRDYEDLSLTFSTTVAFYWINEAVNTSDFKYVVGKRNIFVLTPGFYEIIYEMTCYLYSGDLDYVYFYLLKNDVLIPGSYTYITLNGSANAQQPSSITCHVYVYCDRNDKIVLQGTPVGTSGVVYTKPSCGRLMIKFMAQHGWNNSAGGAKSYIGGVMR